jgi:Arc/MetJ-type ribon-helix-helix transcriptional regulator
MVYTHTMRPIQVYLSDEQINALDEAVKRLRRSRSAIIREAIDHKFVEQVQHEKRLRLIKETSGDGEIEIQILILKCSSTSYVAALACGDSIPRTKSFQDRPDSSFGSNRSS